MVFKLNGYQLIKYGLIIGIGVLGWFGGWWDGIADRVTLPKTPPVKPNVPSINLYKTKLVGWDKNQKAWEIQAKRIWQSDDRNITYFEKIHSGIIYSIKGERVFFRAGWARWEKPWAVLYMGGALTVNIRDHEFKTKEVVMRFQNQELQCDFPIELRGPNTLITAKKMRLNLEREEVTLDGDVILSQDRDQVTSKSLMYNMKDKKYQLLEPGGIILNL